MPRLTRYIILRGLRIIYCSMP